MSPEHASAVTMFVTNIEAGSTSTRRGLKLWRNATETFKFTYAKFIKSLEDVV